MSNEYKAQDNFFWISNLPVRSKETKPEIKSFSCWLVWLILVWSAELSLWNIAAVYHLKEANILSTPYKYNFKAYFTSTVNFALITAQQKACFRIWQLRTLWNHKMNPDNSVQNYFIHVLLLSLQFNQRLGIFGPVLHLQCTRHFPRIPKIDGNLPKCRKCVKKKGLGRYLQNNSWAHCSPLVQEGRVKSIKKKVKEQTFSPLLRYSGNSLNTQKLSNYFKTNQNLWNYHSQDSKQASLQGRKVWWHRLLLVNLFFHTPQP